MSLTTRLPSVRVAGPGTRPSPASPPLPGVRASPARVPFDPGADGGPRLVRGRAANPIRAAPAGAPKPAPHLVRDEGTPRRAAGVFAVGRCRGVPLVVFAVGRTEACRWWRPLSGGAEARCSWRRRGASEGCRAPHAQPRSGARPRSGAQPRSGARPRSGRQGRRRGARRAGAETGPGGGRVGGHAGRFLLQRGGALVGEPVVAPQPPLVDLFAVEGDEPLRREPVEHPVQAADLELDPPVRRCARPPGRCRIRGRARPPAVSARNMGSAMAMPSRHPGRQDMKPPYERL